MIASWAGRDLTVAMNHPCDFGFFSFPFVCFGVCEAHSSRALDSGSELDVRVEPGESAWGGGGHISFLAEMRCVWI